MSRFVNLTGTNVYVYRGDGVKVVFPPGVTEVELHSLNPDEPSDQWYISVPLEGEPLQYPFLSTEEITFYGDGAQYLYQTRRNYMDEFNLGFALIVTASLVAWAIRYAQRALSNGNADPL